MDQNQIRTAIQGGATWMKVSAILSLVYQGLSLLGAASSGSLFQNVISSALSIFLAITLLQAANSQGQYAAGGSETQLIEGLKKETLYLQIVAILMCIGAFFILIAVVAILAFGAEIIDALEREFRNVGGF